ncbi:Ceramidase [Lasallia pustulata]|nr:Ceramidase [Lasallia pustulata]
MYHMKYNDMTSHSIVFGIMIFVVGVKTMALVEGIRDKTVQGNVRRLARVGAVTFVSGFALWLIDNVACDTLRSIRRAIGMPWGFLFELHGWWHILTGVGAYVFIVLAEFLTSTHDHNTPSEVYAWPVSAFLGADVEHLGGVAKRNREG